MFLCALQPYVSAIIIILIVLHFALAVFTMLHLAYYPLEKRLYCIWCIIVLVLPFFGSGAFWIYRFTDKQAFKLDAEESADDLSEPSEGDGDGDEAEPLETEE